MNDLPTELLFNILSRLDITSLVRSAKYTCRIWRSIINDALFPELHLIQALKNPTGYLYNFMNDFANLYFVDKPICDRIVGMKLPGDLDNKMFDAFVSCHGLICYRCSWGESVKVYNPITGDHVVIYPPKSEESYSYGFGYAPLSKKYKFVQFFYEQMTASIHTLGEESWRELDTDPFGNHWSEPCVYLNGYLYCVAQSNKNMLELHVMSLDLETEKIQMRGVLPTVYKSSITSNLIVLGEAIAYVIQFCKQHIVEVWTLGDENGDVWIKKYHIPYGGTHGMDFVIYGLCGLWMDRKLFFVGREKRDDLEVYRQMAGLLYNLDCETITLFHLPFAQGSPQIIIPHVGSLISPSKIEGATLLQSSLAMS